MTKEQLEKIIYLTFEAQMPKVESILTKTDDICYSYKTDCRSVDAFNSAVFQFKLDLINNLCLFLDEVKDNDNTNG